MAYDDSNAQYEWWKNLQELDMTKVRHLIGIYPHLLWIRMFDPGFRPLGHDGFLETFGGDLGTCLDDLNSLHWLLFYYHSHMEVKSLVLDLFNKITMDDLANNERWGDQKNTLLHLVCALGYEDLVLLLLDKGVSTDVPNALGRLPYHVARMDSMANLLDNNKGENSVLDDGHDSPSPGAAQSNHCNSNRSQQTPQRQRVQPSPSTSIDAPSTAEAPTIKKPNKDGHYFRAGHVEETKQKVLTDEQVELQKQRERRRKDIAQLAKRSAVKNNPFVKKSEPSLAQTRFRQGGSTAFSSSTTTPHDASVHGDSANTSSSQNDTIRDKKHKRNSKVINSLQTKSYVSSSIFRQGEPSGSGSSLRQHLVQSQDKQHNQEQTTGSTDTSTTPESTDNSTLEPLPKPQLAPSSSLEISGTTRDESNGIRDSGISSDGIIINKEPNNADVSLANDIQHNDNSTSTDLVHSNEKSAAPDETPSLPSPSSSSTSLVSASTSLSTSVSKASSTYEDPLVDLPISTGMDTPLDTDLLSSTTNTSTTPTPSVKSATNGSSSSTKTIGNKRQSGSQKTLWSKELASWESVLNHEFDLGQIGGKQANGNKTLTPDLDSLAHLSLADERGTGGLATIENGKGTASSNLSLDCRKTDSKQDRQQQQQPSYNKNDADDDKRRHDGNGTIFESSRLPLKSYGSVSVKSMATFSKRLPTFDPPVEIGKRNDPPAILSQIDDILDISGDRLAVTATSRSSGHHHRQHSNHGEREITRSASVSNLSSSPAAAATTTATTHTGGHYYQHSKMESLTIPAYLTSPAANSNNIKSGRGKLYIRVHGVRDILLPLPRDRAHVRCVIGDGRYEYMSRYETLGQDMTFGYECIIDSSPDMIVTLSLHVRPDYMLKKPLSRLFSTNRKRKGSLSAYVSSEDGAVGQTRFAVGDMLSACHRRSYSASFHCFNAWYIHSREKSSSRHHEQDSDQGVLKVIGNFDVELLYLPVSDPSLPVPKNLRECDMAIKMQHWNETRIDTDHYPKIQRAPPRLPQEKSLWSIDQ